MEADGDHRGIVDAVEFVGNRLVEIAHETDLLEGQEILLHQLLKFGAQRDDGPPMATHIGECDARDDAAWADGT